MPINNHPVKSLDSVLTILFSNRCFIFIQLVAVVQVKDFYNIKKVSVEPGRKMNCMGLVLILNLKCINVIIF